SPAGSLRRRPRTARARPHRAKNRRSESRSQEGVPIMIALVVKVTLILTAAFCGATILRRGSAALRHFVWTAALAAILVLPFARFAPQSTAVTAPAMVVAAVAEV